MTQPTKEGDAKREAEGTRKGGRRSLAPLFPSENNLAHYTSLDGRTEGTILGGLTPRSQFRTIAPLGPQGDGQHTVAENQYFTCQLQADKQDICNALQIYGTKILCYAEKIHPVQFLPWRRFGFTARKSPSRARSDCPSILPSCRPRPVG